MDYQVGIQLLNRLWLDFSYLRKHKFRHNFEETINHICSDSIIRNDNVFLLRCKIYSVIWANLMSDLLKIDRSLPPVFHAATKYITIG